jgi:hypothetical protein
MSKLSDIGLGVILASIRFNVALKSVFSGFGFRVVRSIAFSRLTPAQEKSIQLWANEHDLPIEGLRIGKIDDIHLWLDALEIYKDMITHQAGYERMIWLRENPLPKASADYETFLKWAHDWDAKNDEL